MAQVRITRTCWYTSRVVEYHMSITYANLLIQYIANHHLRNI